MGEILPDLKVSASKIEHDLICLRYFVERPDLGNEEVTPLNIGAGVGQALPVVTALLAAPADSLLIIENPEHNLHPKGQAAVGRLISRASRNPVQLIVKTHSDHVLNAIRTGIKEHPPLKDGTVLFFFSNDVSEGTRYTSVTDIKIDDKGTLSEYPEGLLDEWGGQLIKLL